MEDIKIVTLKKNKFECNPCRSNELNGRAANGQSLDIVCVYNTT